MEEALKAFAWRFPREIGYKLKKVKNSESKSKKPRNFVRNRYVENASELLKELRMVERDFFMSVYSFSGEYENGKRWEREKAIIDRMFFDFDCEESLTPALREAKKLIRYLSAVPMVVFSGSKGFHVHVMFEPVRVSPEAIKRTGTLIAERLKLRTCDTQVFEVARLCRVPFSVHSATGLKATLISPHRFMKMGSSDVIRFVKAGKWDFPEHEPDEDFAEILSFVDVQIYEEAKKNRELFTDVLLEHGDGGIRVSTRSAAGRRRRIKMYVEALKKHGRLSADLRIREIHAKSEWIAKHGKNPGAIEHIARVHLVLMMIEEGWSDEEIHKAFRYAKDYNPDRVQYYIDYNRKWLAKKRNTENHMKFF